MERLLRLAGLSTIARGSAQDALKHPDTSETIYMSSLSLVKILRHGRAGVPMEVMGLMLGDFVDDYTINVTDVFAMPQSGTGVSVEAVDPVYQTKMLEMLQRTGRGEMVVGWYHSHPGFGCWLSSVDVATQRSFEALSERAVAVVVDPIQSVKGKVVIDAFRTTGPNMFEMGLFEGAQKTFAPTEEPRQTTSNLGHLTKASLVERLHGLGKSYYSISVNFKMTPKEQKMLQCMDMKNWADGLRPGNYEKRISKNLANLEDCIKMIKLFEKMITGDESDKKKLSKEEFEAKKMGRFDPKRRLAGIADELMKENIVEDLRAVINATSFQ